MTPQIPKPSKCKFCENQYISASYFSENVPISSSYKDYAGFVLPRLVYYCGNQENVCKGVHVSTIWKRHLVVRLGSYFLWNKRLDVSYCPLRQTSPLHWNIRSLMDLHSDHSWLIDHLLKMSVRLLLTPGRWRAVGVLSWCWYLAHSVRDPWHRGDEQVPLCFVYVALQMFCLSESALWNFVDQYRMPHRLVWSLLASTLLCEMSCLSETRFLGFVGVPGWGSLACAWCIHDDRLCWRESRDEHPSLNVLVLIGGTVGPLFSCSYAVL